MTRKLCAASAMISLCLGSVTPALAQEYRFAGQDGPRGMSATINFRVPLGTSVRQSRPTFGLTFGVSRTMGAGGVGGQDVVRQMRFGDFRFTGDGLRHARIGGVDLANLDQDRRLYSGPNNKAALMYAAAALGISIAACIAIGCLDGDNGEDEDTTPPDTSNPG